MDPWAPINGISLDRYAELSAEVSDTQDANKQAEIVEKLGVQRADWDAAKAGWTARMQDMSLMGQVATRFMPMYQAALAKKSGGTPQVSFEDYVAMSGAVPVIGFEGMLQHYKVTQNQWTMIAGHWNNLIPTNPQYMQFGMLVQNESARIRAGGQPKPVTIGAAAPAPAAPTAIAGGVGGGAPAMGQAPAAVPGYGMPPMQQQQPMMQPQQPYGMQPQQQQAYNPYAQQNAYYNAQANNAGAQMGNALGAFGNAFGSFVDGAVGAFSVGARVMVAWSDGNRYPGTVTAAQGGQVQVAFPDGRQVWVPQGYVSIC
jgi:hypothetical protein